MAKPSKPSAAQIARVAQDATDLLREIQQHCRGGPKKTNVVSDYWLDRVEALLAEAERRKL